jgi:hypothetical protein
MRTLAALLFALFSNLKPIEQEQMAALIRSCKEDCRPRVFLLSYPRSGNTWLRFCLEYLTKRPTLAFKEKNEEIWTFSIPLGLNIPELETDLSRPCIWKVHSRKRIEQIATPDPKTDKLIFLVRNYRECLLRDLCNPTNVLQELRNPDSTYFSNFSVYEEWDASQRLLIYYEDLLENPEATLKTILLFLNESPHLLTKFLSQAASFKNLSLHFYQQFIGPAKSQGTDLQYHSKRIPPHIKAALDREVMQRVPHLWQLYLSRYTMD